MKRIGILTSGGDAPGMNNAIRAVVRAAGHFGIEVYGVYDGYKGLVEDKMEVLSYHSVEDIIYRGGTILGSARLPEFKEESVRQKAVDNLRRRGIEALVVIGGDGSYMGAKRLTEMGINCVGLPGTIDNDIASTDYTIGFDTCQNTVCWAIDHIRDTTASHRRCAIIEIMGNRCGDLTLFCGLAEGADLIITTDHLLPEEEIFQELNKLWESGKHRAIVLVCEKIYPNLKEFAQRVTENTPYEAKAEVLGRIQRGGTPSAFDRVMAARMGAHAVECLLSGIGGVCVGMVNNKIVHYDIMEALALPRDKHIEMMKLISVLH